MQNPNRTLVILSGGMDSAVLLYHFLSKGHAVHAISFNYGQRHSKELEGAKRIAERTGTPHVVMGLSILGRLLGNSSQTDLSIPVPEGHYAEESMKKTVVPNRNMIMISIAAGLAISQDMSAVAFGAHGGDHAIYPDCREEFVTELGRALMLCDWKPVKLVAPFIFSSKADIVREGARLGVPFQDTWSCYKGGEIHCGRCGTCVERRLAFIEAGVEDPVAYEDYDYALHLPSPVPVQESFPPSNPAAE